MANVRLLRQQVTDYNRNFDLSRQRYLGEHEKYAADSDAFIAYYGRDGSGGSNPITDASLYYDRETDSIKDIYGRDTSAVGRTTSKTFAYATPGTAHMDAAELVKSGENYVAATSPEGQAIISAAATKFNNGQSYTSDTAPEFIPPIDTAYWDKYSNAWRNYRAAPGVPEQRYVKPPNLTQKEIGILEGKINYADQAKEDTSPTSAFADPEDPYNLKAAGVLTRAIAGKI